MQALLFSPSCYHPLSGGYPYTSFAMFCAFPEEDYTFFYSIMGVSFQVRVKRVNATGKNGVAFNRANREKMKQKFILNGRLHNRSKILLWVKISLSKTME
jgi:hypothetical protein